MKRGMAKMKLKKQYLNYIGGEWVSPLRGNFFENNSPIDGKIFTKVPRSTQEDIDLAIDAAHGAKRDWAKISPTERSNILLKIADRIERNSEMLAMVETKDNGKPLCETLEDDLPLVVDHFRYFAGVTRAEEGKISDLDTRTVSMEIYEPLGVVGQIIPWNFPLLIAAWKIAPALATANCVVLKPAEQTPVSILVLLEIMGDILPAGVLNVVNGFGTEAGQALVSSPKLNKIAFTGSTSTGYLIMQHAAKNVIPVTLECGGKSPNIFFDSIMTGDDELLDKAIEGFLLFAFNQGEVCTCPARVLVQESIYDKFMQKVLEKVAGIKVGNPFDPETIMGAQISEEHYRKILKYINIGKEEGAELLAGGKAVEVKGLEGGFYIQPTIFKGDNKMRIFQEEIFGPVAAVTTFKDTREAVEIANDTIYGLSASIWTRDIHQAHYVSRAIEAGRVWINCCLVHPAHASFGGYKSSGLGRENHKMMLNAYRKNKNIIISYDKKPEGYL